MIGRIIVVTIKSIALVMGFALGLALTFSGLFFIGIPIIIVCIWLFVRLVKKERLKTYGTQGAERSVTKAERNAEEQAYSEEKTGDSAIRENPVADAAASYLIGKAVTDKINQSAKNTTAYRERYAESQKKALETHSFSKPAVTKEKVKLSNGRGGYLHTMPNGNQQLVDFGGRTIAKYDKMRNRTTEGHTKIIGKGNLISQFLS